ncbi:hypothetical protein HMPREF9535_03396 [Escherichia coli MS 78-1]|nr:hypothetical protein HMPREF9535_03396 [Escherichia coli MS 78-1]
MLFSARIDFRIIGGPLNQPGYLFPGQHHQLSHHTQLLMPMLWVNITL